VHPAAIKPFQFDATDCPDLFPPLVALAACAHGDTFISGAHRLAHKESDRAYTLKNEFAKLGLMIDQEEDRLIVHGKGTLTGALVSACGDHRIAMALAVAGLRAAGATEIAGAEAIKKSYPDFFADLSMLGASLSLPDLN
jgi:3-phosphoshikimate 1-carboxyvinyltransferase